MKENDSQQPEPSEAGRIPLAAMTPEYLQSLAHEIAGSLPEQTGFVLLAFPFEPRGKSAQFFYTSNTKRPQAVKAVKAWISTQGK